jgi:DNA-binding transcriptional regulator YiaG
MALIGLDTRKLMLETKFKFSNIPIFGISMTAQEIATVRKSLGLTQSDFARLFDAHVMTISKWERGLASPSPYQASLMEHFRRTANAHKEIAEEEVKKLLVGAGVIAALLWLLSNSKG